MNFFSIEPAILPGEAFNSINPYTNELLAQFPYISKEKLTEKLEQGQEAYATFWKTTKLKERQAIIAKIERVLQEERAELAKLISLEMGKPIKESLGEIDKCQWLCRHFIAQAPIYLQEEWIDERSYIQCQSIGAVLGIMPWNFPFWQVFRFSIPTLLAGNTVLLKHSLNVPQCALRIEQIMHAAIGHASVFTNLFIGVEAVAQVIEHQHTQGVILTGSQRAGTSVGAIAGKELKKCVLELGGSDAFIVLADAAVTQAAKKAAESRMKATGQTCISAKRMIVMAEVAEEFIQSLCEHLTALSTGDPLDPNTQLSVLARPDLLLNLQQQVEDSVKMGAQVLLEGGPCPEGSNYFAPVVLTNIRPGMPVYTEEVFGPVAAVFVVNSEAEAIRLANDSPFGLGAAIWSNDLDRAKDLAKQLDVGAIAINNAVSSRPDMPFGGVKGSGFGKEMGKEGMLEFVNRKTVVIG